MDRQKFTLCVTAIIKNEAPYIEEWICHHRALGVDHFFVFDNNSEDNIDDVLRPYINHGIVTLLRWPLFAGQIDAYNYSLHLFGRATEWMSYIDLDEFIILKDTKTIPEFLSGLEGADQLLIPWRSFGFSGHRNRPSGLVIENYTLAQDIPPQGPSRTHGKTIVRTSAATRVTAHFALTSSQATVDGLNRRVPEDYFLEAPNYDRIQINHYYTKSFEEFEAKLARGQGGGGAEKGKIPFDRPGFTTEDISALRSIEATREQLTLMASLSPSPFRYGSQLAKGAPQPRDPFTWAGQIAISNYLADAPMLQPGVPVPFSNLAKGGNMIMARASDFDRPPVIGAFRNSIHVRDMLRRLGNDIVFDLTTDNESRVSLSQPAQLERNGDAIVLVRQSESAKLTAGTDRSSKSRCYCIGYAIRTADPLRLQVGLSSLTENEHQAVARMVELPTAGYYCGIVELNKVPVRAASLDIVIANPVGKTEIFDLFAIAYG